MEKKLIAFSEEMIKDINDWSERYSKTFTEAVRKLVDIGLKSKDSELDEYEVKSNIVERVIALEKEVKQLSWWTADDNTSNLHNLGVTQEEMQKHINVLTAASKLFKKHIANREIHLQD
jgi:hypothetical protein